MFTWRNCNGTSSIATLAVTHDALALLAADATNYRDVVVGGLLIVGVLGDGDPDLTTLLSGTEDVRCPVPNLTTFFTPEAPILDANTSIVDIVLGGGGTTLPCVGTRGVGIRSSKNLLCARITLQRNNHVLGSRIIGTADSHHITQLVLNSDTTSTGLTQVLGIRASKGEETVLAEKPTVTLTRSRLFCRPLTLAEPRGASVRTKSALFTNTLVIKVSAVILNTRPSVLRVP
jgi:hypothetical protein